MDAAIQGFFGVILGSAIAGVFTWRAVNAQIKESEKARSFACKQEWVARLRNEIALYMTAAQKVLLAETGSEYTPAFHDAEYHFFAIELLLDQGDHLQKELFESMEEFRKYINPTYATKTQALEKIMAEFLKKQAPFRELAQQVINAELQKI